MQQGLISTAQLGCMRHTSTTPTHVESDAVHPTAGLYAGRI